MNTKIFDEYLKVTLFYELLISGIKKKKLLSWGKSFCVD